MLAHYPLVILLPGLPAIAILFRLWSGREELLALVRSRRTRVRHGLEHATIAQLEHEGYTPKGGCTFDWGFVVHVKRDRRLRSSTLKKTTTRAINRVLAGDTALTITPECGTSMLVGVLLAAVTTVVVLGIALFASLTWSAAIFLALFCLFLVQFGSRPLGLLAQRFLTVSTDFRRAHPLRVTQGRRTEDAIEWRVELSIDGHLH